MLSNFNSATKNGTHIDHCSFTNFNTNINYCSHHNNGIVTNRYMFSKQ